MQRDNDNSVAAAAAARVHPACAACKHQRKKCDENCILAPYFPADRCREFQAVHKVFGVSNATKIVRNANGEEDRKKVADSLIWEAFCWQKDPVLGPYGDYRKIYEELNLYKRQNRMMQLQDHDQSDQVFKMAPMHAVTPTWNTNNNNNKRLIDVKAAISDAATLRCYNNPDHVDGNSLVDFSGSYGYPNSHSEKPAVQEKGVIHNTTTIVPLQYYTSDVGFINGKTMESTRWDNIL
ncbi:hypothetical protein DITRI_Ditri18aG0030900 [Diplodiscus trichospermus]